MSVTIHQLLDGLQHFLENAYDVPIPHRVSRFLTSDRSLVTLAATPSSYDAPEQLLIRQEDEMLDVSLYIEPALGERLKQGGAQGCIAMADLAMALEGVSHFHYLVWNAERQRRVSGLELELQAEVDKFLTLANGKRFRQSLDLHRWLYDQFHISPNLTRNETSRYRTANYYAARYWRELLRRYPNGWPQPALRNELRRFFRLPREAKMARIKAFCA